MAKNTPADETPEDDTGPLVGEEWAAAVEENPWPGNAIEEPGPDAVEDYEPHFDRSGTERRVLGHITEEDHVGRGPRNTIDRLALELQEDPNTRYGGNIEQLEGYLDSLKEAGLVDERDDGTLAVTDAGRVELAN